MSDSIFLINRDAGIPLIYRLKVRKMCFRIGTIYFSESKIEVLKLSLRSNNNL